MTLAEIEDLVRTRVMGFDPMPLSGEMFGPAFARDIAAAFLVVRKLQDEGFQFDLSECIGNWDAEFDPAFCPGDAHPGLIEDVCNTAPLAICLAALATRGIVIDPATIGEASGVGEPVVLTWDNGPQVFCLRRQEAGRVEVVAMVRNEGVWWVLYNPAQMNAARNGLSEVGAFLTLEEAKRAAHELVRGDFVALAKEGARV